MFYTVSIRIAFCTLLLLVVDTVNVFGQTSSDDRIAPAANEYIVGADISWVQAAEARGVRFSEDGQNKDILAILKDHGFNFIRLRVFNDPTQATPRDRPYSSEGFCDLPHTIEMAKRVKAAQMGLLIDFHYSDSWADPGKQFTPAAWNELSFDELVVATHEWTESAIRQMKEAGVPPDMVQIGNEISPGMMTDRGGSTRDWNQLGRLLKAGIAAVREVDPSIRVVLHIDKSGDKEAARQWVDSALEQGVPFDILGLSCYRRWHGPPAGWKETLEHLEQRYPQLSFMIVELAQEVRATNQIMRELPHGKGLGTFIWEPTANNNGQALFDRQGAVIPEKMRVYDEVTTAFTQQAVKMSGNPLFSGWYADPEGIILGDRYWIYPTYSAPYDQQIWFDCFSSPDLVTWTKHSRVLSSDDIKWARRAMWAPSVIQKGDQYYFFFGANDIQNDAEIGGIGVAVADTPAGPFRDYLGKPLVDKFHHGAQPIDQFVFQDADGSFYLIYGGWRHCNIARLNDDFTGFVPFDDGTSFKEITPEGYVEGPFMFIRNGKYYFMWSEGGWTGPNYSVAYAIADSPFGPFHRIAKVLQQDPEIATGAGHHSVIHVPGTEEYYAVYHRRPLGETDGNSRVTCIDRMEFDERGYIKPIRITHEGVPARPLN